MCDFHVGQLVICVDDSWAGLSPLIRNSIYTVASVSFGYGLHPVSGFLAGQIVELAEVKNPFDDDNPEDVRGFAATRFRPLDDHRLDVFRAHLAPLDRVPA